MCYINCPYENRNGECTRGFVQIEIEKCPHEEGDEENGTTTNRHQTEDRERN